MIEFIDCSSLSISYDATGKVTISFSVVKDDTSTLSKTYTSESWGGVSFDCVLMSVGQRAMVGTGGWCEWSLSMEGVGN